VVIATGEEGTLELLYTHVIKRALPNAAVQIVRAKTTSLSELLRLPELGVAGLLVVLINNLDDKEGPKDWMERRLEFLRQIRDKTNAELIVLSGVWGRGYEERFRTAGADRAERLPIRNEILEQSAREAFQWWPARILQNRGPYRGQVFARR
jgi:hypothetical protein